MMKFFSKLTGSAQDYDDFFDEPGSEKARFEGKGEERHAHITPRMTGQGEDNWSPEEPGGELAVDVYQTPDSIVIKALVAGVQPQSIDISLRMKRRSKKKTTSKKNSSGALSPAPFSSRRRSMWTLRKRARSTAFS
jgi:HSP20 family molecular chaperone IbpA